MSELGRSLLAMVAESEERDRQAEMRRRQAAQEAYRTRLDTALGPLPPRVSTIICGHGQMALPIPDLCGDFGLCDCCGNLYSTIGHRIALRCPDCGGDWRRLYGATRASAG